MGLFNKNDNTTRYDWLVFDKQANLILQEIYKNTFQPVRLCYELCYSRIIDKLKTTQSEQQILLLLFSANKIDSVGFDTQMANIRKITDKLNYYSRQIHTCLRIASGDMTPVNAGNFDVTGFKTIIKNFKESKEPPIIDNWETALIFVNDVYDYINSLEQITPEF